MKNLIKTVVGFVLSAATVSSASGQTGLVGFANYSDMGCQGTTGGMKGETVHVNTRSEFEKYAKASQPYVIILDADLVGSNQTNDVVSVSSNKTIIGGGKGATLTNLGIDVKNQQNIIIRNLRIVKAMPDAIAVRNTHHVWIDHCDLSSINEDSDDYDGLLDFTVGSTYLTVSWCKFHDHDKTSLCSSGTRNINDYGRQRVTYHHNAFINCAQRNPRIGYGLGNIFNDYNEGNSIYGVGIFARVRLNVENCYFKDVKKAFCQMYSEGYGEDDTYWGFLWSSGNEFAGNTGSTSGNVSTAFDLSSYFTYDFAMDKATDVPGLVSKMGCIEGIENDIIPFPGDGAVNVIGSTELTCGNITNVISYRIQIGKSADSLSDYNPASFTLEPLTTYFWNVTVVGGENDGKTSPVFRFTTADSKARFPMPENGNMHAELHEIVGATSPCEPLTLTWRAGLNDESYIVSISKNSDMTDATTATTTNTSWRPGNLRPGEQYYWRVDTKTKDGSTVTGDVWTFGSDISKAIIGRNEAEDAVRGGLCFPEKGNDPSWINASNGYCTVGDEGPGYLSYVWTGKDGRYDITTAYFDEAAGQGIYALFVNDEQKDKWTATVNSNKMVEHLSEDITLATGDEIRIEFYARDNMRCRTDYIEIKERILKESYLLKAIASPAEGGTVSPVEITALLDEEVTFSATPAEGYMFKNWTLVSTNEILSTNPDYTLKAIADREICANFELKPQELSYHVPRITHEEYGFELVDASQFAEERANAETGKNEWKIKNEYSSWVIHTGSSMNVSDRTGVIELDPVTGQTVPRYTYGTNKIIRVGTSRSLTLRLASTQKIKIYFNGAASTPGHLVVEVKSTDGDVSRHESNIEVGKKTTVQSDALEIALDAEKKYEVIIKGTQDMAVWALNLWPGANSGINSIVEDTDDSQPKMIYSIDGRYLGSDPSILSPGIYIIDRKKVLIRN